MFINYFLDSRTNVPGFIQNNSVFKNLLKRNQLICKSLRYEEVFPYLPKRHQNTPSGHGLCENSPFCASHASNQLHSQYLRVPHFINLVIASNHGWQTNCIHKNQNYVNNQMILEIISQNYDIDCGFNVKSTTSNSTGNDHVSWFLIKMKAILMLLLNKRHSRIPSIIGCGQYHLKSKVLSAGTIFVDHDTTHHCKCEHVHCKFNWVSSLYTSPLTITC